MAGQRVELAAAPVSFIGAWYLENIEVCASLVRLFQGSLDKKRGLAYDRFGKVWPGTDVKDSIDLSFPADTPEPVLQAYFTELQKVVEQYIAAFPTCNEYAAWTIVEQVNIQFYGKGGGFKRYHTERMTALPPYGARHLVFMTYLNDVHDGGGTEFQNQKLVVAARTGLTLIWPADWTHTHRGVVSSSEEKYIITGWFSFV
jgi:hypothetical protein